MGAQRRRTPRSPPDLQEARSWQRQDRRPLFPSRPPPAAPTRRHAGSDRPVPARRGPQRTLPQAWAAAYRRGVGLGPRTRRPGADTPCAVVPPSSWIPGRRPVLFNRILAPARLRLRCDAACWPSDANTTVPGRTARTCRQCSPRRAPSCSPASAPRRGRQFSGRSPLHCKIAKGTPCTSATLRCLVSRPGAGGDAFQCEAHPGSARRASCRPFLARKRVNHPCKFAC